MAIFSLNHSFIGRTTHRSGSASLYARYINGDQCTLSFGERLPTNPKDLFRWLDEQERGDRKNARVIDKVIVALPTELSQQEQIDVLRAYCERMTEGRASWFVALHHEAGNYENPHAHIIFRDRDFETGKRVILTTEAGSTLRFREAWAQELNLALERAGAEQRVDHRSLADQGIDREPEIHVGAGALELAKKGHEFESKDRDGTRQINGRNLPITVHYSEIDEGKSRFEENEERKARNRARAADNGEYPYVWTDSPLMVAQQESALLWAKVAQKRMDGISQDKELEQLSAIAWVQVAQLRAQELYQKVTAGENTSGADPGDMALVVQHMRERGKELPHVVKARENELDPWESSLSDEARAIRDEKEKDQDRERGRGGLEM